MKFAVGYQQTDTGEPFRGIVRDYRDAIAEVYFPWPGCASGRASLGCISGAVDWSAQAELERDLAEIRGMGIKLDLLFNANCYGGYAISSRFRNEIVSILSYLESRGLLPEIITTTSPFVAHVVRKEYPEYDVRVTILGHVQRGGSPTAADRILATRMGEAAITALTEGQRNVMVGIQNDQLVYVPFSKAIRDDKPINRNLLQTIKMLSI